MQRTPSTPPPATSHTSGIFLAPMTAPAPPPSVVAAFNRALVALEESQEAGELSVWAREAAYATLARAGRLAPQFQDAASATGGE